MENKNTKSKGVFVSLTEEEYNILEDKRKNIFAQENKIVSIPEVIRRIINTNNLPTKEEPKVDPSEKTNSGFEDISWNL